ncbi:MAG: LacI family DNA-binding transcriptional regulator [Anaerolineaceae bacterium]
MNNLTLEDIAEKSGVSRSTVSRVLNDHPNVSKKVREHVKEVIQQTGYQPHAAARALVSNRAWTCGLILPRSINTFFTDPYYPCLIQGIAQACSKQKYTFSLFLMEDKEDEDQMFSQVSRRGFMDGILFQSYQMGDTLVDKLVDSGIPLVILGRPFQKKKISHVDINNIESVETAVQYLLDTGHKRIGTITGPQNTAVGIDRKTGYQQALLKNNIPIDENLIVEGTFTEDSGYLGMKQLLPAKPDAIFAASDQMALGAMHAIRREGLEVPRDISIIGYDDFPMSSPAHPALTTLRQPIVQFCFEALKMLISLVEDGLEPYRQVILKSEFIIRNSTRDRTL